MLLINWLVDKCFFPLCLTFVRVISLQWCVLWMGCILHHCRFLDLAGFVLASLHCLLAGLTEVHCLCFPHSLASLLWLIYSLLLPGVSEMSCNPSLCAWTLISRRWMHSVYGMVRLACHLVIDYTPLIPLTGTFCCCLNLHCRICDTLNFCGHLLGRCCPCIPRLLDYENHNCRSCGIFSFD
jgi:hypothetical protein